MTNPFSLDLDLAALLCARLCHDLAGPVGAVNNGAELLGEGDAESVGEARDLIAGCAGQTVRRLRFYRLAYGSHDGAMDWAGAMRTGAAMLADSRIELSWRGAYDGAEGADVAAIGKLALNMLLLAANALPKGGALDLFAVGEAVCPSLAVRGEGPMIILDERVLDALAGGCRRDGEALTGLSARFVQSFLTGILAADFDLSVSATTTGEGRFEVSTLAL